MTPPPGRGSWEPLLYGLHQMQLRNKKRRRELGNLIKRFRSGAESLPDAVVLTTEEGGIFWCNGLAQQILGLRWPEDNGQNILNLLRYPEFTQYLKTRDFSRPLNLVLNTGRHLEIRVMPYTHKQLLMVARDVTQMHQLEGARRNFFANVSHELRTPLTVLQGYLEMMNEQPHLFQAGDFNMRPAGRSNNQVRPVTLTRNYTKHAEGSVLVEFGDTKVLCTASIEEGVPRFLKGQGQGWITAEYGMLPRSTHTRNAREAAKGKQGGRTMEIQRLIARALRAAVDLKALGEFTITLDCDVLQADGGTRTASITGACVALADALQKLVENGKLKTNPMKGMVAAVSVGIVNGEAICDLEYVEDSAAETDMNVVMTEDGRIIEVQGTAEGEPFTHEELLTLLALARGGIESIVATQKAALAN